MEHTHIYTYVVTFIDHDGREIIREVMARHEFEAIQLAGAFNRQILSIVNLDA
ncbi:MAG: hypothetical protein JRJ79_17705 [Deltaproteobacteria bacterium]|nr:hypothetical protein [Deltaproteobacteria bacterium]